MKYVDLRARLMANSHVSDTLGMEIGGVWVPCRMWDGAVVKSKRSSNYYPRFSVRVPALDGAVRQERAHRAMFEIHYGIKLFDHQCNHLCAVTLCIEPLHLEKTTHKQNMRDRDVRRAS